MKCEYTGIGIEGDLCPICGRSLHRVDSKEFERIITNKFKSDPDWLRKVSMESKNNEDIQPKHEPKKGHGLKISLGLLVLFLVICIYGSLNAGNGILQGFWIFLEILTLIVVAIGVLTIAAWVVAQFVKLVREFSQ